jgi:transcription initiation factor IIE alpha subunit
MTAKRTHEQFITEAKAVHGDKYDLSQTVYVKANNKITYICRIHGLKSKQANAFLRGQGCNECAIIYKSNARIKSQKKFIADAITVHGDKYDLSNTIYINSDSNISYICLIHGLKSSRAKNFLEGQGCNECGSVSRSKNRTKSQERFIAEAIAVHGDNYDLSTTIYTKYHMDIYYICPIHGLKSTMASNFLRGQGCNECRGGDTAIARQLLTITFGE